MRVVVTGKGKAGSWAIRGEQLGAAIGAVVKPHADLGDLKTADVIVVVKRTPDELLAAVRASGRPWVLDLVDGWPQPAGNAWCEWEAKRWLRQRLAALRPSAVVFATTTMREDSGWEGPALVLPHHAWPKYERQPVAVRVSRVGYEGAPEYLGKWRQVLDRECAARGWRFVVNGDLATCQIGVALRDVSGYPAAAWKANTKLANLQALGLPALISPEQGYREFGSMAQTEIVCAAQVGPALDALASRATREQLGALAHAATPRLQNVARKYREWLVTL